MNSLALVLWGYSIGELAIGIIIAAGIIAIVCVILARLKITPPEWFMMIVWIIVAVVVGTVAIRFLMSL